MIKHRYSGVTIKDATIFFKSTECIGIDFNNNSPHTDNCLIDCGFHHIEVHYNHKPFNGVKNSVKKDIMGQHVFVLNEGLKCCYFLGRFC